MSMRPTSCSRSEGVILRHSPACQCKCHILGSIKMVGPYTLIIVNNF